MVPSRAHSLRTKRLSVKILLLMLLRCFYVHVVAAVAVVVEMSVLSFELAVESHFRDADGN